MADGSIIIDSKMNNKELNKGIKQMQGKLKNASGTLKKVGGTLTKSLTVPIAGLAAGAVKMAADFDSSMSEVQAISGATGGDMEKLENVAREMGATTKFSASEAADGLKYMALAGWETEQMATALPAVLDLAAASGADLGTTSDIVTDALSAFGMEASDAAGFADLLASASSNSNTNVEMLGESFKYVAPVVGALGASADDTALALGIMANAGIKGSQSGTQLRTILSNMIKPTDQQAAAMRKYGIEMIKNADGTVNLKGTMDNLRDTLGGLDETQQAQAASTIFGKEAMSGALAIVNASEADYQKLTSATTDYDGAAAEMAATMQDNLKGAVDNLKSALSEAAITLGQSLTPMIQSAVGFLQDMTDKFNALDDSTKQNIVKFGLLVAALGPLISIMSGVLSLVGTVSGAVGVLTGATVAATPVMTGLATAFTFMAGPGGVAVAAITGIVAAGGILAKHLSDEAIPEVDRFGDEVSQNTQEAVGAFMDMAEQADVHLKELAWSQQEVTAQMALDMQEQQQNITDNLLSAIDERNEQETQAALQQFENMSALTEQEQQKILENIDKKYEEESAKTEEGNARINEIVQLAADEGREIRSHEAKEIESIRRGMQETAVEVMSQSELEQKAILERIQQNSTTITAKEAAEVVKNATDKKNKVVEEANSQYDETIAWAIQQRDEAGTMSSEEAARVIEEAELKRNESVSNAEEMHSQVVSEAKEQAGEHVKEVDWSTGEIKTKWQVMKDDVVEKAKALGTGVKTNFTDMTERTQADVRQIASTLKTNFTNMVTRTTEDAAQIKNSIKTNFSSALTRTKEDLASMKSNLSSNFSAMVTKTKTDMGNVKRAVSTGIGNALQSVKDKYNSFKEAGANIAGSIADGISSAIGKVKDAAGSIAGAVRDFLPFSPAKEGPLRDLDKLNFGGPIEDSIDDAIPSVQAEMNHLLKAPMMEYAGGYGIVGAKDMSTTYGDTNITIVSPENTPSENARQMKRVGKELGRGY